MYYAVKAAAAAGTVQGTRRTHLGRLRHPLLVALFVAAFASAALHGLLAVAFAPVALAGTAVLGLAVP
jgi:hypothetical protein